MSQFPLSAESGVANLAGSLRKRLERDVYVASAWHRHAGLAEKPHPGKWRTVKRPDRRLAEAALWRAAKAEGRAPAQILVGAVNTYGAGRGSR